MCVLSFADDVEYLITDHIINRTTDPNLIISLQLKGHLKSVEIRSNRN